jgi:hypothetical protein
VSSAGAPRTSLGSPASFKVVGFDNAFARILDFGLIQDAYLGDIAACSLLV